MKTQGAVTFGSFHCIWYLFPPKIYSLQDHTTFFSTSFSQGFSWKQRAQEFEFLSRQSWSGCLVRTLLLYSLRQDTLRMFKILLWGVVSQWKYILPKWLL